MCWNKKSVIASNGLTTTYAWCPNLLFNKNETWPLMMANFIFVSEKSASKIPMCSKKPLSGGVHDLFMRSFTRSCNAVFGSGYGMVKERSVSYTHLRAHETRHELVCRLLLEKKNYM